MSLEEPTSRAFRGFHVAAYAFDGALVGLDHWGRDQLSDTWLAICSEHLAQHGANFDAPWLGKLSHIQTQYTSSAGIALVTFSVHGRPVSSLALLTGQSPAAETEALELFVDSLQRVELVHAAKTQASPFADTLTICERPLMVVVPWPDPTVTQQDHELVRELAIHLSGAFFSRNS